MTFACSLVMVVMVLHSLVRINACNEDRHRVLHTYGFVDYGSSSTGGLISGCDEVSLTY